jgi:hypothetical protein
MACYRDSFTLLLLTLPIYLHRPSQYHEENPLLAGEINIRGYNYNKGQIKLKLEHNMS